MTEQYKLGETKRAKIVYRLFRKGFIEPNNKVRGMEKGAHYELPEKPRSVNFRLNWDYKQRENDFQYETIVKVAMREMKIEVPVLSKSEDLTDRKMEDGLEVYRKNPDYYFYIIGIIEERLNEWEVSLGVL